MDENPFNAGSPGPEEVDLYGKFRSLLERIYHNSRPLSLNLAVDKKRRHG
jgi:hypothetical protein